MPRVSAEQREQRERLREAMKDVGGTRWAVINPADGATRWFQSERAAGRVARRIHLSTGAYQVVVGPRGRSAQVTQLIPIEEAREYIRAAQQQLVLMPIEDAAMEAQRARKGRIRPATTTTPDEVAS